MPDPDITLYWRPGCGFCWSLRRKLGRTDLVIREVNIWEDPSAAATVRSYADGNETVPTVVIGAPGTDAAIGLVNPSTRQVLDAVDAHRG
jgi:glutaredoxin